ncbi:MAG: DUF1467 family protein [Pseudomonadota bacterium]
MQIVSAIAIYFIIWWVMFFMVLTLGNREPDSAASRVDGADQGAPAQPKILRKVVITTVAAAFGFAAVYGILNSGLTLDDIPLPSPPGT